MTEPLTIKRIVEETLDTPAEARELRRRYDRANGIGGAPSEGGRFLEKGTMLKVSDVPKPKSSALAGRIVLTAGNAAPDSDGEYYVYCLDIDYTDPDSMGEAWVHYSDVEPYDPDAEAEPVEPAPRKRSLHLGDTEPAKPRRARTTKRNTR